MGIIIGIILSVVVVLGNIGCLIDIVLFIGTGDKIGFIAVGLIFGNIGCLIDIVLFIGTGDKIGFLSL